MHIEARLAALQHLLVAHEALWRPQPFHGRPLAWRESHPVLAADIDALEAAAVHALEADPAALAAWMAARLPDLAALGEATRLPERPCTVLAPAGPHFSWQIPGRKQAQIEAFAAHAGTIDAPILEWCAGKGHLGRRLGGAHGVAVTSLEIDPQLSAECATLAARSRVDQVPVCADALASASRGQISGRHVVALHACGELHRTLVRHAGADGARAYTLAPCCYHRWSGPAYVPLSATAGLTLDEAALRLAVTETVTAPGRERRHLARDQAFKLGFAALRAALTGEPYRRFKPVPAAWPRSDFEIFCRRLAEREGLALPAIVDWAAWEATGWRRQDEVARDSLVRHAFRRALELWLVGDLALALQSAGFEVGLGVFCERALSPRNLLIDARR